MSKKIPYEGVDGAVGYITDVTKEDFYINPDIGLYDELEQSCYELVCDFAELIGVHLDKHEQDCRLANMVRDFVGEMLEKEFEIEFPSYGETELERDVRVRDAKITLFKLAHKEEYKKLWEVAAAHGDVCVVVDAEHGQFILDSGSSESLMAVVEQLGISSDNVCNSPVAHIAYVDVERHLERDEEQIDISAQDMVEMLDRANVDINQKSRQSMTDLDSQISFASTAKEYELTLFQGRENEEMIRAFLTEEQVELICKGIAGKSRVGDYIEFPGGERIDICHINAIEILDGDTLVPEREVTRNDKERD